MNKIKKYQKIVVILLKGEELSSSQIHAQLEANKEKISLVTVKRQLTELVEFGLADVIGSGRSTSYVLSVKGRVLAEINPVTYCQTDPDKRYGLKGFNFGIFEKFPVDFFSDDDSSVLKNSTLLYRQRIKDMPMAICEKELQRFVIELSWKSSKLEGNTYTLLDTEKLILENIAAVGKSKNETRMILNHKDAFEFVRENSGVFKKLERKNIEELHRILVKELGIGFSIRKKAVGITGSIYRPLDNEFQISEALNKLTEIINRSNNPFAKALLAVLGISYIQPFEDGNKRTGRLLANAILLANNLAPLSYRSIDEKDYREAILVFYELNSIMPFKKIFVEQYDFAARNYAVGVSEKF